MYCTILLVTEEYNNRKCVPYYIKSSSYHVRYIILSVVVGQEQNKITNDLTEIKRKIIEYFNYNHKKQPQLKSVQKQIETE